MKMRKKLKVVLGTHAVVAHTIVLRASVEKRLRAGWVGRHRDNTHEELLSTHVHLTYVS
jgi:hypothetical protein